VRKDLLPIETQTVRHNVEPIEG